MADASCDDFKNLPPMEITDAEMPLPADPDAVMGELPCGLRYYIKKNRKPEKRVALRLAVRVGSVEEEEEERGLAHLVEHLAFRATTNYDNFELVKYLESIGASFGACQNAYTAFDETVYMLTVPTDTEGLVKQSIQVLHEWATRIRVSDEDVEGERGVVLEEWRAGRTAAGRMAESYWRTLTEGSKYADRMPIGLEEVIRGASGDTVRGLHRRLYRLGRMAAVIVGDFDEAQEMLAMLQAEFASEPAVGAAERAAELAPPPAVPVPPHAVPRISSFEDAEATSCEVHVECKTARREQTSHAATLRRYLCSNLFSDALNQRLYTLSKREDAPFYAASAGMQLPCRALETYTLSGSVPDGKLPRALRVLLEEVERVRVHGFSDRELRIAKANYLTELKTSYLERHQLDSAELARECCAHFTSGELMIGIENEVRASKALLEQISAEELRAEAAHYAWESSCVVKIVLPTGRCCGGAPRPPSEAELRAVLEQVVAGRDALGPWQAESSRESLAELLRAPPVPGKLVAREADATGGFERLALSNGVTLLVKPTKLQDDELLLAGYARGGLSELPRREHFSGAVSDLIATESGAFGCPPAELLEILAGKSVTLATQRSLYARHFSAECSPHDLEACLTLVHLLFTVRRAPTKQALGQIKQMLMEGVLNQQRDPHARWAERVSALNTCGHFAFRKPTVWDVRGVQPAAACAHYDASFASPAEFTLVMVGAVDVDAAVPLLERWLASIPAPAGGRDAPLPPELLTPLPVRFPAGVTDEAVRLPMVDAASTTQLTWPVELDRARPQFLQGHELGVVCRLLEARLLKRLRFADSDVYSVSVGMDFATHAAPSPKEPSRGTLQVAFSSDPSRAAATAASARDELRLLRDGGPSAEDVSSACEIARREHEENLQANGHHQERLRQAAFATRVPGTLGERLAAWEAEREQCLREMSPAAVQRVLQAALPHLTTNYTAVALLPAARPACGALGAAVHEGLIRCAAPSW